MVNREDLAKKIIELRNKKQYSQRKLAMVSGVSNSTISRIENATSDTDPETLKKLAPFLDTTYEELMKVAGYIKEYNDITEKTFKEEDFSRLLPIILQMLNKMILGDSAEKDMWFTKQLDFLEMFEGYSDEDQRDMFNNIIDKIRYTKDIDTIDIYPKINIDSRLSNSLKKRYLDSLAEQNKKEDKEELPEDFNSPEEAIEFLLEKNVIMGFGGFDVEKLSDDEKVQFAHELLEHLKLLSLKYKK